MQPFTIDEIKEYIEGKAQQNLTGRVYLVKETPASMTIMFRHPSEQRKGLADWIKPTPALDMKKKLVKAYA